MRHAQQHTDAERYTAARLPHVEQPHEGTITEAPNGHGTYRAWPPGKTLNRPVLDGSTQSSDYERDVDNPWRGFDDPGLIVHPEWGRTQRPRWLWWRRKPIKR
ncbi:MAG: hypothetical protein WDA07_03090 [Leucobacter sp.]